MTLLNDDDDHYTGCEIINDAKRPSAVQLFRRQFLNEGYSLTVHVHTELPTSVGIL